MDMKVQCYLIIDPKQGITGMRKSRPTVHDDERILRVVLDVPNSFFLTPTVELAAVPLPPPVIPTGEAREEHKSV